MKQKKSMALPVMWILCLASLVLMTAALVLGRKPGEAADFVPPAFETEAVTGTPAGMDDSWMPIYQEGMPYSAHVCGRVILTDGAADLYFTNDPENTVWMKLRITDEAGSILAETGLLKPGQYLKRIPFDTAPKAGTRIRMKIMAYEPETFYSAGAVTLNTVIGG